MSRHWLAGEGGQAWDCLPGKSKSPAPRATLPGTGDSSLWRPRPPGGRGRRRSMKPGSTLSQPRGNSAATWDAACRAPRWGLDCAGSCQLVDCERKGETNDGAMLERVVSET